MVGNNGYACLNKKSKTKYVHPYPHGTWLIKKSLFFWCSNAPRAEANMQDQTQYHSNCRWQDRSDDATTLHECEIAKMTSLLQLSVHS